MMRIGLYPAYRHTSVTWLGDIPEHWQSRATKRLIREISDKGHPELPLLAATQSMGVVRKDRYGQRTVVAMTNLESLKRVQVDDFVISLRSFQGGIERAYDEGILSSAYTVLRHDRRLLDAGYLARLFKSKPFLGELELNVTGIREGQNINYGSLRETHLPLPPFEEQRSIADFLDGMDARITRFIAARRKMIALLEEKKQAVINRAVTRGLDPDVPMKDSGVEWLGEIPAHWEVRRLGTLTSYVSYEFTNPMPSTDEGPYLVTAADIVNGSVQYETARHTSWDAFERLLTDKSRPIPGDILVTKDGTLGRIAVANNVPFCINQSVALLRLGSEESSPEFLAALLSAATYQEKMILDAGGTTIKHIYITRLVKMEIALPPLPEQNSILDSLGQQVSTIDALKFRNRREIELMQEYRTRLISDVVTGKLDVRGVELPAVEEVIGEEIEAAMVEDTVDEMEEAEV
jgi:type I restriction enzyme, S subunit